MTAPTVRLSVESLDPRNAPSDLTGNVPATTAWLANQPSANWLPAYVAAVAPAQTTNPGSGSDNAPPVLTEFTFAINPGWVGVFSGKVTDQSVTTVTVRFGGSPECLQQKSVGVAADGTFEFQGQLHAPGDSGTAWAEPVDAQGLVGNSREVTVFVG